MVLQGLGVRNKHNLDSHHDQLRYTLRMAYYGTFPQDDATKMSMPEHRDYVMTSMIVQHQVEGLQVQLKDGGWFAVPPETDTCTIVAGSLLTVKSTPSIFLALIPLLITLCYVKL
jgi:isopenicillin N synthase-like dioxygenase